MRRSRIAYLLAATVAATISLAGCSAVSSGAPKSDPKAPLTIWVDTTRADQAKEYAKAHPSTPIKVVTIDDTSGVDTTKLALAEKAGSGIPDVVFLGTPDEIAAIATNPINYPVALNNLVSKKVLDGYPEGTISRCTYGSKVYCLGNDIGQTVLWYNKAKFSAWGYTVPKTFDEFKALGIRLAAEHPGYSLGTVNGAYGVDAFFGSSGCPIYDSPNPTTVKIDLSSVKCTRVGDVIGPLMANHTLLNYDPFDKDYVAQVASGHVIATIGASWEGDFVFEADDKGSSGQYAAAPMPTWSGESTNYSGTIGGGTWIISNKSNNTKGAVAFVENMVTSKEIAAKSVTYPAYGPSTSVWLATIAADRWWAEDTSDAMKGAAGKINPAIGYVRYKDQMLDSYSGTVLKYGATDMTKALKDWGVQTEALAKSSGYKVEK
jgi:ABC-type glycerol-3-phosphate transport system substrate-binding protein